MVRYWDADKQWQAVREYYGFDDVETAMYFLAFNRLPEKQRGLLPSTETERKKVWAKVKERIGLKKPKRS